MKAVVRYTIDFLLAAALAAALAFIMHGVRSGRRMTTCNRLEVEFRDSLKFVSKEDISNSLTANYGPYIGQHLDSLRLDRMEELIESRSAVLESQAWTTDDGVLHISISQRVPEIRFGDGQDGYYIDKEGYVFPLHKEYTAPVLVIGGAVPSMPTRGYKGPAPSPDDRAWFADMLEFKRASEKRHRGPARHIDRIWVENNGDIVMRLDSHPENFIFGKPQEIEEKFAKIDKYFAYIKPFKEDGQYKTVNLKYKNQIICRQRDI